MGLKGRWSVGSPGLESTIGDGCVALVCSILPFRGPSTGMLRVGSVLNCTTQRQLLLHPLACQFELLHHVRELFFSQSSGNIWPQGAPSKQRTDWEQDT